MAARERRSVRVLFVQHGNPAVYPPVERAAWILAESGCQVSMMGVAHVEGTTVADHPRIAVALHRPCARGWQQKIAYLRFAGAVLARARQFRPDWIYASDPLATPAALAAGRLLGVPGIYHEHDAPEPGGAASPFMRLILTARRRYARAARLCVVPSVGRGELLARGTGRADAIVVWNTPSLREVAAEPAVRRDGGTKLLFHGSIVPARVPESLLHALAAAPESVTLTLTGYDPAGGSYLARLRTVVGELGLERRVHFTGTVAERATLMAQASQCDVGLALLPMQSSSVNEQTMLGASNKPFDYMARGLALMVPDLSDWRTTFVDGGYARACNPDSVDSLVEVIRWFDARPEERRAMGEHGRRQILNAWHYERGFQPIRDRILAEHLLRRTAVER